MAARPGFRDVDVKRNLDRDLVERLLRHIEDATTDVAANVMEVPMETYTSAERLAAEMDVLFFGQPLVLCLSGALPASGSYLTVELCGTPVLLTRSDDGQVRALANICRHRGVRVADGTGRARRFVCPFHGWAYDLDGKLVGVPAATGFATMCRDDKGLVQLPVAEAHGLVVGRLRPGPAVDVDDYLGPELPSILEGLSFAGWELERPPHRHLVKANWKVALDTFRENYHLNYLHRRTLGEYNYGGILAFDAFGPHLRNTSAVRGIDRIRGCPAQEWGPLAGYYASQYGLFPNIVLSIDARHIEFWQVQPIAVDHSEVLHSAYVHPNLTAVERADLAGFATWVCDTVVDGEDFWVAERTEPGIRSGLAGDCVIGRNEPGVQHSHAQIAAALQLAGKPRARRKERQGTT